MSPPEACMAANHHTDDEREQLLKEGYPGVEGIRIAFSDEEVSGRWASWIDLIERNGGIVEKNITEETDYLVTDTDGNSGVIENAANHNVPTIDEAELRALFEVGF